MIEEYRAGPSEKQPALRMIPLPKDLNPAGDVFGGYIMANVDLAGSVPAVRRTRGRIVTVAVNSFIFKQRVSVGDLLSFYADIVKVGKTSITVDVHVYAERNPSDPKVVKVTEAQLTYVAIDAEGNKRVIPPED